MEGTLGTVLDDLDFHPRLPEGSVIAVAMSGGVDSSVAALACQATGFPTIGITLALWPKNGEQARDRGCCSIDAAEDARRVASTLGIPHYVWDMEEEFDEEVIREFEHEYESGRTPNPCVRCNERIKFGVLWERAVLVGATHLATGHYASIDKGKLTRGKDPSKDQSYTLYRLPKEQLSRALFPLGKTEEKRVVRHIALGAGLTVYDKPDSQELCFVKTTLKGELKERLAGRFSKGTVVASDGSVIGEHEGIPFYTVGQRSGLVRTDAAPDLDPRYVLSIDADTNTIVAGTKEELLVQELSLSDCAWLEEPDAAGKGYTLQCRAHGTPYPVKEIARTPAGWTVRCDSPVGRIAPGQSAVLYEGDAVVGGGIVEASRA